MYFSPLYVAIRIETIYYDNPNMFIENKYLMIPPTVSILTITLFKNNDYAGTTSAIMLSSMHSLLDIR